MAIVNKIENLISIIDKHLDNKPMTEQKEQKQQHQLQSSISFASFASFASVSCNPLETYNNPRSQLIHNTALDIYSDADHLRRTGIICTIGPISRSVEMLTKLIKNGLDVVRLNFSHGTHEYHTQTKLNALQAAKNCQQNVAIALDTKGPEIRTGNFVEKRDYYL